MIALLFIIACGEDSTENHTKVEKQHRREERKRSRDEKYQIVIDDLEQTKTDMRCIREFVTEQQQTPDEKMDYSRFEKIKCKKVATDQF